MGAMQLSDVYTGIWRVKKMIVVSMFDGISCGQIALNQLGFNIEKYFAFEIKPYAIKVTQYHYPDTIQMGDVRSAVWESIGHCDLLLAGSPCQDLSKANNKMLGLQGEKSSLFFEFIKAKEILKPKYYLLENVSTKQKDYEEISKCVGTYPVNINSSLVSAQLRNRNYWTNIGHKNFNLFGFPTCAIEQPKNRNIVFSDIKENNVSKEFNVSEYRQKRFRRFTTGNCGCIGTLKPYNSISKQKNEVFGTEGKIYCLLASDYKAPKVVFDNGVLRYITPLEYERLQTLPDNYTSIIPKKKRYEVIGDGWNVETIKHILKEIGK